jgi:hypothetical protein
VATTEVEDVDGRAHGGVLAACLVATTTEVEDVDGVPPKGCWNWNSGCVHHQR